jgi:hypothetical protein
MELDYFEGVMEKAMKELAERKNATLAFLVLSRAVHDNISPKQVLSRYEIEEVPIKPATMEFRDIGNRPIFYKVETQLRLVRRNRNIRIPKFKWLDCQVSLLQTLNKVFNAKQVKNETNSSKQ